jgi:cell division septation protein DedD
VPPPAPVPAPPSSEPKKIHTVIIRSDGSGQTDTSAAAAPHSTTSTTAPEAKPSAAAVPPVGNQPLPLAPDAHGHAAVSPPSRSPMPVGRGTAAEAFSGGGYAVQVASERSAADAHAVFRTLQAKFPNQLGGREPIVRRTDLGAEGIYYRVIVGPFASIEEAAGVCSTLKAAGGNCRVERD